VALVVFDQRGTARGWKFEFDKVKEEQKKQKDDIDRLKFSSKDLFLKLELKHLSGLIPTNRSWSN